jgi:RHS repeat-associated protein
MLITTTHDTYKQPYDGAHNQTSKTDSKGVTNYYYDSLNRLEKVIEPSGKTTSYIYDKAGNRLNEIVMAGTTSVATTYIYNEQNRLTSTVQQSGSLTVTDKYMYDNNGNTISKITETVKPVDSAPTGSFSFNKAGQSTTSEVTYYTFDVWNQLVKTISGDKTVTCSYNAEGYRVSKAVNGKITKYLYEGDKVILETDGAGNQTAKNVYGTNLLTRTSGSDTMYYMYNGHADVTTLLNTDGTIAATYYYDAFGNKTDQTGNANNNITYAGYQYDKETDLYYLNARYYDSKIARFMSEDTYTGTASDPLSLNLYTYCHNEPLMYSDPTGHKTVYIQTAGGSIPQYVPDETMTQSYSTDKKGTTTVTINAGSFTMTTVVGVKGKVKVNTGYSVNSVTTVKTDQEKKAEAAAKKAEAAAKKVADKKVAEKKSTTTISQGTGKTNGATIRNSTPQELANDKKTVIIQYIPVASTINNIKILATGSDLYGHFMGGSEIESAKQNVVIDAGTTIMTAGIGKAAKYADDLVEGAITSGIKVTATTSKEIQEQAQQILKQPIQNPINGQYVAKPGTQVNNALKKVTTSTRDMTQDALYLQTQQELFEEFSTVDNAGGVLDALVVGLKIAVKVIKK